MAALEQPLGGGENLTNLVQETSKDSEQVLEEGIKLTEAEAVQERNITFTSVPDNFVNLETTGPRRSPRNHNKGILPPNCFGPKLSMLLLDFQEILYLL